MNDDILKRSRRVSLTVAEITFLEQLLSKEVFDPDSMGTSLFGRFQGIIAEENDTDLQRIKAAYRDAVYTKDGEVESDCDAEVSIGDSPGAYVQVWQWVDATDAGVCVECGLPGADNGEGYDGLCGTCADKADAPAEITCMSCGDTTNSDDSPDDARCPDCHDREESHV
jgi:hypothetical protein